MAPPQASLQIADHGSPAEREADAGSARLALGLAGGPPSVAPEGALPVPPFAASLVHAASGPGEPLPPSLRASLAPAVGGDLDAVRVHADRAAGDAAAALGARAFTRGWDIFFAPARYQPATREGRQLLAHELVHALQLGPGRGAVIARKPDESSSNLQAALLQDYVTRRVAPGPTGHVAVVSIQVADYVSPPGATIASAPTQLAALQASYARVPAAAIAAATGKAARAHFATSDAAGADSKVWLQRLADREGWSVEVSVPVLDGVKGMGALVTGMGGRISAVALVADARLSPAAKGLGGSAAPVPAAGPRATDAWGWTQGRIGLSPPRPPVTAAPVPDLVDEPVASAQAPTTNDKGRAPTSEDLKRIAEYDLARQYLEVKRREKVAEIQTRVDDHLLPYEQDIKARAATLPPDDYQKARAYIDDRKKVWPEWVAQIDEAIAVADAEQKQYRAAMAHAADGERIVWHSSQIGAGWLPESYSAMQREMESSPFWQLGFKTGVRYRQLRDGGRSPGEAILAVAGLTVGDLTGVTNLVEAISGSEVITGRELPAGERWLKGILGAVSVASLVAVGGPRIGPFAKGVGGTRVALMRTAGEFGKTFPVLLVAEGQATLALTQAEALTLAQAGLLQMAALGSGSSAPSAPSGLKNASYGPPRGGGGSPGAKSYAKKVTGRDDSVYVNGTEFDGYRASDKTLLDAKLSKGQGSWYDVTGADNFTKRFKIPEILEQAKRQLRALRGSGAKAIEWSVSDANVALELQKLFSARGIRISVVHLPP